jgi:general secretion pathway protein G
MNRLRFPRHFAGFTFIELIVTVAIVALLATMVFPMAELAVQRSKERDLREALRQIRGALDAYKKAVDEKKIASEVDSSGYPPNLAILADGVVDAKSPNKDRKIYFLRRIPRDPMNSDPTVSPDASWGRRSYRSPPEAPRDDGDVFDVYSRSPATGLNGVPYRKW